MSNLKFARQKAQSYASSLFSIELISGALCDINVLIVVILVLHLIQSLCICGADKVGLHVVDATIGVHEVLIVLPLNLDDLHNNAINHVD